MTLKNILLTFFIAMILISQTGCDALNKANLYLNHRKDLAVNHRDQLIQIVQKEPTIQQSIIDYLVSKHINGSVAIVKHDKVIFNRSLGYANLKTHALNTTKTTYPIGSITKIFVATSIMQLQEKGKLSIEDPLSKYIPNFPNGRNIKLVNLLSHTSGIQKPFWEYGKPAPLSIIKEVEREPLKFQPGTKWDYKDVNYIILGYIVQKVAHTSLHDYIQRHILAKAGMKNSGFLTRKSPFSMTSYGYKKIGDQLVNLNNKINTYYQFGCGDIYVTALDLTKFDEALFAGKLVSKQSLREMLAPRSISNYGLGLYNYGNFVFSRGVLGGWEALHIYFKDKTAMSFLLNIRDKKNKIRNIALDIHTIVNIQRPHQNKVKIS